MDQNISPGSDALCNVDRGAKLENTFRHIGRFDVELIKADGSHGGHYVAMNKLTNSGCAYMLNRAFFPEATASFASVSSSTVGNSFHLGLIQGGIPTLADDDSANNVGDVPVTPRWDDWNTVANGGTYDNLNKPAYPEASDLELVNTPSTNPTAAVRQFANALQIDILITGGTNVPVGGVYMANISNNTWSAATTLLFSTALFSVEPSVSLNDTLKITYTHTLGPSG